VRAALGQFNPTVGDFAGNLEKMRSVYDQALAQDADVLIFGELALCGYPPEDLLFKEHFIRDGWAALEKLAVECAEMVMIVGFAEMRAGRRYNSAAVLQNGGIADIYHKMRLPATGVFDDFRYFQPGSRPLVVDIAGAKVALTISADIWKLPRLKACLEKAGPIHLIANLAACPFSLRAASQRLDTVAACARQLKVPTCCCNLVGGQDEIVFDGKSFVADQQGNPVAYGKGFAPDLITFDLHLGPGQNITIEPVSTSPPSALDEIGDVYNALVLGTKDYCRKNNFKKAILGISGGIDSAVSTAVAAGALGPKNVTAVTMPTRFNSPDTVADAETVAANLKVNFHSVPISDVLDEFNKTLSCVPGWDDQGVAYENLQARIRGNLLMSLSNQSGAIVLTSGNKSEAAVGYATLYGDTAGGFAILKDVPKTMVYRLAEHINRTAGRQVICSSIINRPPTAELRADQKDTDSLPDYPVLDRILRACIEEDKDKNQIIDCGFEPAIVEKVIGLVNKNEYKRRQSPPGVKITPKAFGRDRRLPITNHYEG